MKISSASVNRQLFTDDASVNILLFTDACICKYPLPKIKIMPRNFQDMILGLYVVHQNVRVDQLCHTPVRTPVCTPVCTPDFSNAYIKAKNDNATKLSGYDP